MLGLFLRRIPAQHPPQMLVALPAHAENIPALELAGPEADVVRLETRVPELEADLNAARQAPATPDAELSAAALDKVFRTSLDISSLRKPDLEKMRTLVARLGRLDEI
jgi:hypothetical protein